jgi:hypothetical protein
LTATQSIHHHHRERVGLDVFADAQERSFLGGGQLQRGHDVGRAREHTVHHQYERVVERHLHAVRIGDEVGRGVAAGEARAVHHLERHAEALALLHRDDTVRADRADRLRDQLAELGIAGREGRDACDVALAVERARLFGQHRECGRDGGRDAAAQRHRVAAGHERREAVADDLVGQDGGGTRAIARLLPGAKRHLAQHLHAHVLERVGQLQLLRHRDAVARDRGHQAVRAVEHDAPAARPERDAHGGRELVDAPPQRAAGIVIEADPFAHGWTPWPVRGLPGRMSCDYRPGPVGSCALVAGALGCRFGFFFTGTEGAAVSAGAIRRTASTSSAGASGRRAASRNHCKAVTESPACM